MSVIEPGQLWRDKVTGRIIRIDSPSGAHDGLWNVLEPDYVAGEEASATDVLTEGRIVGDYELADNEAAVEAGGEPVGPNEVEGPNSA